MSLSTKQRGTEVSPAIAPLLDAVESAEVTLFYREEQAFLRDVALRKAADIEAALTALTGLNTRVANVELVACGCSCHTWKESS